MNEQEDNVENKEDKIEQLHDSLYDPEAPEVNKVLKRDLSEPKEAPRYDVQGSWHQEKASSSKIRSALAWTTKEQPIFKKLLWIALGFFILSFLVAAFLYFRGVNNVSPNKIDISLNAPLAVSASNPWGMDISINNRNNSDLVNADIVINYPEGSRAVDDVSKPLVADVLQLGTIGAGEIVKKRGEILLFGEEGEKKKIKVVFHYKVPGSSSVFKKEAEMDVLITAAPVTVSIESVRELNSNQNIAFDVKIKSNSNQALKNVAVDVEFPPFGFTLENSSPALQGKRWVISDLLPEETKEFKLSGRLRGEKDEQKNFKFTVGSFDPLNPERLSTEFVKVDRLVTLKLPFIDSAIVFEGEKPRSGAVNRGDLVAGSITFANNLSVPIQDVELRLTLKDNNLIDRNRIHLTGGYYSSLDNTLIWNKLTDSRFESLSAGQSGKVTFDLPFIKAEDMNNKNLKNLTATFDLTLRGNRISERNVPEQISTIDTKTLRVGTEVDLSSAIVYSIGPFKNTGPIPPKANQQTSYTVIWTLKNTLNDIRNSKVTASLPPYVKFEGSVSPNGERVTFNQNDNVVTWDIGTLFAGEGYRSKEKQVAFKIILTPSDNQISSAPALLRDIVFEGTDSFTEMVVNDSVDSMNTHIRQDPAFNLGDDMVQR
jgi:hypothetical protein